MNPTSIFRMLVQTAVILAILICISSISSAQPRRMSPEERVAQLQKELNLSDEQAAKAKMIYEAHQKEVRKLFDNSEGDRAAMREGMLKQNKETDEKIAALLDKKQKEKFAEIQNERRQKFEQRQGDRQ